MWIVSLFVNPVQGWNRLMATLTEITDSLAAAAAAQAALLQDVANVQGVVTGLAGQVTALQAQVADLQAQIASGSGVTAEDLDALKAQADALAAGLVSVDSALDAIAPDPVAAPAPETPPAG
jgi:predicted  nucleic acid-binding Zn-ribbon protein